MPLNPQSSRLRLFYNLFLFLLRQPGQFAASLNRRSIKTFLRIFLQWQPAALEDEIKRKVLQGYRFAQDTPGQYFRMLSIPKEKNRILVVDRFLPAYDTNSGALRMYSILNVLVDLGCRVTFIPENLESREPYVSILRSRGIETVCGYVNVEDYLRKNGPRFDVVILSEALAAIHFISLVRAYAVNATVIYDTVDLHWIRLERAVAITADAQVKEEAEYFKKIEHCLIGGSDVIFTVTQTEKDLLLTENPALDVHVVPNVHDAIPGDPLPFSQRRDLMFIGHYYHQPNVDAVKYFTKEVLPLIRQRIPGIKFYIVGSNPTQEVMNLQSDDVIVTGYAPDVSSYFGRTRVFVAPLRFGAGMKGKIGQSMAFGLPVVTTDIGAEGMGLENGRHALIANGVEDFVRAVEHLYSNEELWQRLAAESRQFIHNAYSTSAMTSTLSAILDQIAKKEPVYGLSRDMLSRIQSAAHNPNLELRAVSVKKEWRRIEPVYELAVRSLFNLEQIANAKFHADLDMDPVTQRLLQQSTHNVFRATAIKRMMTGVRDKE